MASNKIDWDDILAGLGVVFVIIAVLTTILWLVHMSDIHSDKISRNNTNVQIAKVHACNEIEDINQRIACFAVIGANDSTRK